MEPNCREERRKADSGLQMQTLIQPLQMKSDPKMSTFQAMYGWKNVGPHPEQVQISPAAKKLSSLCVL